MAEYMCPPVMICGFNRPDCLKQVFDRVREARPSQLFLVLDALRDGRPKDVEGVLRVARYLTALILIV